jgi:hypothetical protein
MGVDDENLGSDADMSGGVGQSDVAAGDPGPESKSRRAVGNYLITYMGTWVPSRFCQCPLNKCPADAMHTFHSISSGF